MSNKDRKVKQKENPGKAKEARSNPISDLSPIWSFSKIDVGDPWCFSAMDPGKTAETLQKLGQFEGMTWTDLKSGGSHLVATSDLVKEAQERLEAIKQDDVADLFSFRLTGVIRIWGIKDQSVIRILWYDSKHQVCPSLKKHT